MVGVDDGARPAASREQRGDPACRAGLRGVRVEDVRAPVARMRRRSSRIAAPSARTRELPLQRREALGRHSELVGDVLHRLLAGGQRARDDDDVVSAPLLLAGELEHVERGSADVQPRDHVHDRHAR